MSDNNPLPLKKLLADNSALKWLKDNPEFGSVDNYRGGKRAFSRNVNPESAEFVQKLDVIKHRLTPEQSKVADWFLTLAPRDVAIKHDISVKLVYRAYARLRTQVNGLYDRYRDEQVGVRAGAAILDTLPEHCSTASRYFEYGGQTAVVYRVTQESGDIWVDKAGQIFSDEVQDLLNSLHDVVGDFTVLEAE